MDDLSGATRFLSAFNEIENHLRSIHSNSDDRTPFMKLAEAYANRHRIQFNLPELRVFGELRNTLAHSNYYRNRPIAEPAPEVVDAIEALRDKILRPPKVLTVLPHRTVVSFRLDDPIRSVLEEIRVHDYSQFPVTDDHGYHGLLTTNCIARWLAPPGHRRDRRERTGQCSTRIRRATRSGRPSPTWNDRGPSDQDTVATRRYRAPPAALIITETGRRHESALSIVVADDLPTLVGALSTRP